MEDSIWLIMMWYERGFCFDAGMALVGVVVVIKIYMYTLLIWTNKTESGQALAITFMFEIVTG